MELKIIQGNVIDAKAGALILTIDGAKKGMEGNIARAFARRWPEVWEEIEEEIPYPLALGKVFDYDLDSDCPFRLILIASTLHHKDSLSEPQKKSVVRTALEDAMDKAREHHIDTSATGLMVGGWRLSATSAFMAMIEGYETSCQHEDKSNLDIYILNPRDFQIVQSMAVGMGWRG